ncbi:MAG: hypothetical protein JNL39_18205 [Opitutaceae bacterium]|nr:hypothetical protein [Opitutaceae bacterium]
MDTVHDSEVSRPDAGHLAALGYLQVGTGVLTVTMSLMALVQVLLGHHELFNPARAFDHSTDLFDRAIAAYVLLQLTLGWVAGGLQLAAGVHCMRGNRSRLVWVASVVSLVNFPHGTIAAIFTLLGLTRAEMAGEGHARG